MGRCVNATERECERDVYYRFTTRTCLQYSRQLAWPRGCPSSETEVTVDLSSAGELGRLRGRCARPGRTWQSKEREKPGREEE